LHGPFIFICLINIQYFYNRMYCTSMCN